VYTVGNGSGGLLSTGNNVFLREYTPTGSLVQSIAMPSDFIASGLATSEGQVTVSPNGRYLSITGFQTAVGGSLSLTSTTSLAVPRSVLVFDNLNATYSRTNLTDFASFNQPRSAVTTNGTDIWVGGGAGGVRYTTAGSTTSTGLTPTLGSVRTVNIFNGQLYTTATSGANRLVTVGTGTPTSGSQTVTNLPGIPTTGSPMGYFFADLNAGVAGVDTLYIADEATGLSKYSLVGGTWVANGTIGGDDEDYRGLTATVSGSTVTLYTTRLGGATAAGGGELVSIVDTAGYNATITENLTVIASAANNTAFRGLGIVTVSPIPEPGTVLAFAAGALGLGRYARRKFRKAAAPAA
jgi:hypothetical protein